MHSSDPETDLRNQYPLPTFSFLAKERVVEVLKMAGVTEFKIRPWADE
ncbi:MAG TPA: hypothetical protein VIT42_11500 [Microlunatus sp.]